MCRVFISSTYKDLAEERKVVFNALMKANCTPIGMENFVAQDDEQFNAIKKDIDSCEYYILIIGRCYGSISEKTNKSYTEMEFDYAVEQGKTILVFPLNEASEDKKYVSNEDDIRKGKLAEFIKRAKTNRLAKIWKTHDDLAVDVVLAIKKAIEKNQVQKSDREIVCRKNNTESNITLHCVLNESQNKDELTPKELRNKYSDSGYVIEIYNMGLTPVFIDSFGIYYKKYILADGLYVNKILKPYKKVLYELDEQTFDSIEYHRKKSNIKKCDVVIYDVTGKQIKTKLDIEWLKFKSLDENLEQA